jgi:DNA helicase-2/ATP-dependent DNA helicase PcrA
MNAYYSNTGSESAVISRTSYSPAKSSGGEWRVGQTVTHAKFGTGVIINYEGSGSDARVQVNFDHVGTKWLLLEYAKLTANK